MVEFLSSEVCESQPIPFIQQIIDPTSSKAKKILLLAELCLANTCLGHSLRLFVISEAWVRVRVRVVRYGYVDTIKSQKSVLVRFGKFVKKYLFLIWSNAKFD